MVGQKEGASTCALNEGRQVEAGNFNLAATYFLNMKNMQHMYGISLSTYCIQGWGARPDSIKKKLKSTLEVASVH